MVFYERFIELCQENNVAPSKAVLKAGCSNGTGTNWKKSYEAGKDTLPDGKTLVNLANFLGCSVDYLLGRSEIRNTKQSDEDVMQQFNALSPTNQEVALKFIRFLKSEE